MKRKTFAIILVFSLAASLCACGSDKKPSKKPTPAPAPTLAVTEAPVAIPDPTPEPTPEINLWEPVATPTPEATQDFGYSPYTFTNLDTTKYAIDTVNVRSIPSTDGEKLGKIEYGSEVYVTGQCNENSWYRINYHGSAAYVKNDYFSDSRPAVAVATPAPVATVAPTPVPTAEATASAAPSASPSPAIDQSTPMYPTTSSEYNIFVRNGKDGTYYTSMEGWKMIYMKATAVVEKYTYTAAGIDHFFPTDLLEKEDENKVEYLEAYGCECCSNTYETDGIHSYQDYMNKASARGFTKSSYQNIGVTWMGKDGTLHNLFLYTFTKPQQ